MKKFLLVLFVVGLCLPTLPVCGQLVQSSSLITSTKTKKKYPRYESNAQFAVGLVSGQAGGTTYGVAYTGGYRFNNMFYLGAGAEFLYSDTYAKGYRIYLNNERNFHSKMGIPVFVHFKMYFLKKKFSPFLAVSGGYQFAISGNSEFGYNYSPYSGQSKSVAYTCNTPFFEPTVGVSARILQGSSLYLGVSYRMYSSPGLSGNRGFDYENYQYRYFTISMKSVGAVRIHVGVTF